MTFNEVVDRRNTRSVKWDLTEQLFKDKEILPMWVADMDFQTPKPVVDALVDRASHGIFGYTVTDEAVHSIIKGWLSKKHDWEISTDWLSYSPGVVPSLHTSVEALTEPEDSILIQTPVYPPFYDVIKKHDRNIVTSSLQLQDGRYEIDFEDFEEKIQNVKAFILCNPHNPVGRVWTEDELQRMADLCIKHDVLILSDEIHADLVYAGHKHIPIASLSDEIAHRTTTYFSPTKTFNIAGLQASYIVTPDEDMKKKIDAQFGLQGLNMLNTMGVTAIEASYEHGEEWLNELVEVLDGNKHQLMKRVHEETNQIQIIEPEGTYLVWMDCRGLGLSHNELKEFMRTKAKVGLNDGASFGKEGEGFMRINIATPPQTLNEGIDRIVQAVNSQNGANSN